MTQLKDYSIYQRIDMDKIYCFIEVEDGLTEIQKTFYKFIIKYRYDHIIKKSYLKLVGEKNE